MDFANEKIYLLMQVNDSVFPIGGYTQSYGLETYVLQDRIKNAEQAFTYISHNLKNSFLYSELLVAAYAYDYAKANALDKIIALDETMAVTKTASEIRDASEKLGSRFVKTISTTAEIAFESNIFSAYLDQVNQGKVTPNHAVAYGVFCAAIGAKKETALTFYLYAATSAMVTNSVKLVPLSQTQGQQILHKCHKIFDEIIEEVGKASEDEIGLSMPGLDIRCMQHEVLYSRLYMS